MYTNLLPSTFRLQRCLRWCWSVLAIVLPALIFAQEICDNGIDDDGNGLIDLNDSVACPCNLLPPPQNLITNGSFEQHSCCPGQPGQGQSNFIDCATGWTDYQISASVDFYDPCGFFPPMIPQPVPDGNAVAGMVVHTWPGGASYEYLTQCLATPLVAGQTYELGFNVAAVRMQFNFIGTLPINFGPLQLAIYGLDTCPPLPYTMYDPVWGSPMPAQYCPTELGLTLLGTVTYTPSNAWQPINFTFQPPFNVGAIMFGPACPIPQDYNMWGSSEPYFFFDDFSLVNNDVSVLRTGHPCTNDLVLTAAPYDAPPNSYQWYLDGVAIVGQTGSVLNASALGLAEGTYAIRMIRADGSCVLAQHIVAVQYPQPLAQAAPASGCAPLNTVLTNLTDPALSGSILWDLGDGSTSNATTVQHTYTNPGTYDVRLTVTSAMGCVKDSLFQALVTVHPKPVASFVPDSTIGCTGTAINFTSTTTPTGNYTYQWSFGDGGVATTTTATVQHTYNTPGTYNVMLMATSAFGCMGEVTMHQLIQILPTPAPAFSFTPDNGCVPLNVRFDNLTPDPAGMNTAWDLGNGQTDTSFSTNGTYTAPGAYSVSLTMTNALGCSATLAFTDTIHAFGLPVVTFSAQPDTGCAPLLVQFNNTTDPGMIGGCLWQFGDGSSSTTCSNHHVYQAPGIYTVSLTVNSPAGCEGDTTLYHLIRVHPAPTALFSYAPRPTDFYQPQITFNNLSSSDVINWWWTFEQGNPANSSAPDNRVNFPGDEGGLYPVQLVVANIFGCTDTILQPVKIDGVFSVYVPNAFTPDRNGINDLFTPVVKDADPSLYDFSVFDRWGTRIFHSTEIGQGWDGSVDGAEPKTDVYNWRLRVRSSVNAETRLYNGMVVLLR